MAAGDCGGFRRREREARRARLRTAGIPSEAPGAGAPASANPAGGRGGGRGPCSSPTAEGRALGRLFALGALGCLGTGSWERADSLQDAPEPKATENEKA